MHFSYILAFAVSVHLTVSLDITSPDLWSTYKEKFNKVYSSSEKDFIRKKLWEFNHYLIKEHNDAANQGLRTYHLEENEFSDWDPTDKVNLLGLVLPSNLTREVNNRTLPPNKTEKFSSNGSLLIRQIAACVDYRNSSCLPPVQYQGSCGSCWAFAAAASVEYYNCKKKNFFTSFSRQELVSCDTSDYGCDGGFYTTAWNWARYYKECKDSDYPYISGTTGVAETCITDCTKNTSVSSYKWLTAYNSSNMQNVLATNGPIAVSIYASQNFLYYSSGVYEESSCPTDAPNHAVVIVGCGVSQLGVPYWIIQNSWGTFWGMNGYAFIRKGVNMCGIERYPAIPVV